MAKGSKRLISLDIFRGLTLAFMIIVNTPGSWEYIYPPLEHSKWNGCTPTDLVFPFFLFIVGISTWFSLKKYGNELNGSSLFRIFRRMVAIFLLGLLLNSLQYLAGDSSSIRIMGVLQRIALAYGVGAAICLSVRRRYLWIVTAVILLSYWGLLAFFGGADPYSLQGNLVLKTDLVLLGRSHLYTGFGIPFDPEGLLSTIPAVATVIIGYYIGGMVSKSSSGGHSLLKLFLFGAAASGLGLLWGLAFPINKPLWTSSYVLYTAGLGMVVFAVIYLIADVFKFQSWGTFFRVFGTNAIFAYVLAGLWTGVMLIIKIPAGGETISLYSWLYSRIFSPVAGHYNGSLLFAIVQVLIIWSVTIVLYRKKIFIRL
jgi:predicted acyltransferase